MSDTTAGAAPPPRIWNDPKFRGYAGQAALLLVVGYLGWEAFINASTNMARVGIPTGFSFMERPAGFDINQTLIPYSAVSSNLQAFWVGLLNTLVVGIVGIIFATMLGFAIGAARLSKSWLLARMATVYVELVRNVPLLLQLLFWYNAVLTPLPAPRNSLSLFGLFFVNNRGLVVPSPVPQPGFNLVWLALLGAVVAAALFTVIARKRQRETGQQWPVGWIVTGLLIGLPVLAYLVTGRPLAFEVPVLKGFNFAGGSRLSPELVALTLSLVLYTASFIAEIVRAGIMAVNKGQGEAAISLGMRPGPVRTLVVMPQAMRVIIPPLTSQYLNLIKNSSLAVFIGYPDLVQIFAGTVLNNTGAAVQVIAITMAVYLFISIITSVAMNEYNKRMSLKER